MEARRGAMGGRDVLGFAVLYFTLCSVLAREGRGRHSGWCLIAAARMWTGGSRGFDSMGFKVLETAPSAASPGLRGLGPASNFDRFPPSII